MKIDEALSVYFGAAQPVENQGKIKLICIHRSSNWTEMTFNIFSQSFIVLNSKCNFFSETQFFPSLPVRKCPSCGQDMIIRTKKDGKG